MRKKLSQRPERFRVNRNSPLFGESALLCVGEGAFSASKVFGDSSPYGIHPIITCPSTASISEAFKWDNELQRTSYRFDDYRYALITGNTALNQQTSLTIAAWIKTSATSLRHVFGGYQVAAPYPGYGFGIGVGATSGFLGKISFWRGSIWVCGNTEVGTNWRHIAVAVHGTTAEFFLDGRSDGTTTIGSVAAYTGVKAIAARIVGTQGNPGELADVIVFPGYHPEYIPYLAERENYELKVAEVPLIESVRTYYGATTEEEEEAGGGDQPGSGEQGGAEPTAAAFSLNDFLERLGTYIQTCGVATPGYNLFYEQLPESPDNCLGIFMTGGSGPSEVLDYTQFQIIIRGTNAQTVRAITSSVYNIFDNVFSDVTNCMLPGYVGRVTADHRPGPHDFDPNGLPIYSLNFRFLSV